MDRISNTALTSMLDLRKYSINISGEKIFWKFFNLSIPMSNLFKSLTRQNQNRVLYYGVSVLSPQLQYLKSEQVEELLNMDEYYDTSTKENVLTLYHAPFSRKYDIITPGSVFNNYISNPSFESLSKEFPAFIKNTFTEQSSAKAFFDLASVLLCNIEFEGILYSGSMKIDDNNYVKDTDTFINYLFHLAKLPEPTIDYFTTGDARVIGGLK